jgi:hypothetical protein
MSLVEEAKAIPTRNLSKHHYTDEEIELTFAWLKGEVSMTQASSAHLV